MSGETEDTGWAEWSVDQMSDCRDVELWYETNPSMGTILNERKVRNELGENEIDFNIQRLGLWLAYNQKSAIGEAEWEEMKAEALPELKGKLFVGIKFGKSGENVALSIAVKTNSEDVFVESIDCRPIGAGNDWLVAFLRDADVQEIIVDGASGQQLLKEELKDAGVRKKLTLPTVAQVIESNAVFVQCLESKSIRHAGQPSLVNVVTNCEKRAIGSNGGFGFKSIKEGAESALMDSMILALWACKKAKKEPRKQRISY